MDAILNFVVVLIQGLQEWVCKDIFLKSLRSIDAL